MVLRKTLFIAFLTATLLALATACGGGDGASELQQYFLCVGVVGQQRLGQCHCRDTRYRYLRSAFEELAAVDLTVAVLVVEVENLVVDLVLVHCPGSDSCLSFQSV